MQPVTSTTDVLGTGDITIPAGVHAVTEDQKGLYRAAVEFERFFVSHMMKQMEAATKALKGAGDDDEAGSASTGAYNDMVTDQMTQSVLDGGGLGLAAMLYGQLTGEDSAFGPGATAPAEDSDAASAAGAGTSGGLQA